jgi:uncharacterized protein (DUF1810 family)
MQDAYNLERFVAAQAPVYHQVLTELAIGRKRTHWMWFIFPQMAGLGRSAMAQQYAIDSLAEAAAYLAHPLLGARLRECCRQLLDLEDLSASDIFGDPDDMKLHSSLTLFAAAAPAEALFQQCLDRYFGGVPDTATLALIH